MAAYHWQKKGVPHVGWKFIKRVELASQSHKCEMCDKPNLKRYDVLHHEDFETELKVGVECSEAMQIPFKYGIRWPSNHFMMILKYDESSPFCIATSNKLKLRRETFDTQSEAISFIIDNGLL